MTRLVIDPILEAATNAPLDLWSSDDGSVVTTAVEWPAAQQELVTAGSINTEGDLPAARRHQNAPRSVTVEVLEPTDAAATNLVTNPSMETGTTGWTGGGSGTIARSTSNAVAGDYALRLSGAGTNVNAISSAMSVTAGLQYAIAATVNVVTLSGNTFDLGIQWFDGTSTIIGSAVFAESVSTTGSRRMSGVLTAPVGAVTAKAYLGMDSGVSVTVDVYTDAVSLIQASAVSNYFDGDTPGCAWTGTPHASSSTRPAPDGSRFRAIIADLQAKAAKVAALGGTLRWVNPGGDAFTADLIAGEGMATPLDFRYFTSKSATATFNFTALPYWRGDEVTLSSHTETTLPALIFTETGIQGDVPALGRLVVTDTSGTAQNRVFWGVQSYYYSADSTAALLLQAESGTAGAASSGGTGGASGGLAMANTSLTTSYVYQFTLTGGTWLGQFRVLARAQYVGGGNGSVYLDWQTPTGIATNAATSTLGSGWQILDLGVISIRPASRGTTTTDLYIAAKGANAGDDFYFDFVLLLPIAEGSGEARGNAIFANKSLQISDKEAISEFSTKWVQPSLYEGDYLTLPVAGPENRTLRVVVKMSSGGGSVTSLDDDTVDDHTAQLFYRPRYLTVR